MLPARLVRISAALAFLGAVSLVSTAHGQLRRPSTGTTTTLPTSGTSQTGLTAVMPGPAPAGVTVTGTGVTGQVSWQPVMGASYVVQRWFQSEPDCCRANSTQLTSASWTDTGLLRAGVYVYRVVASYADGTQGAAEVTFTRPTPLDPAKFAAQQKGAGLIWLTWTPVAGVTTYLVSGPGTGPSGRQVTGNEVYLESVPPAELSEWTIASVYNPGGVLTDSRSWPKASTWVPAFGAGNAKVWIEGASTVVDITIPVHKQATTIKLFHGVNGVATTEIQGASITRTPGAAADNLLIRHFPTLAPQAQHHYQVHGLMPDGRFWLSMPAMIVTVPVFMLRTTVPPAADRVILEWNAFGTPPYTVKKGLTVQQGGTTINAFDEVRDASGNPIQFTGVRFDDMAIQRGVTYRYQVCAAIPGGHACPQVEVTVP